MPDNPGVVAAFESFYTGNTPNTAGVGIVGVVTDPNTEGAGVAGIVQSPNAVAGYFRNDASPGPILIASMGNSDTDVFDVFGNPSRGFGKVGIGNPNALATLTVAGSPLFPLTGTVSVTNNSNQVTGTGTLFGSEVGVGDRIQLAPNTGPIGVVAGVINNTSLILAGPWSGTTTSGTFNDTPAMFRIDDPTGFTKLVLDGTGALGIGNVAPTALLDVQGRSLFRNRTVVSNNGTNQHPALLQVRAATFNALAGGTVSVTSGSNLVTAGPNTNFGSIGLGDKITVAGTIPLPGFPNVSV